jgi:hypothetical protein
VLGADLMSLDVPPLELSHSREVIRHFDEVLEETEMDRR